MTPTFTLHFDEIFSGYVKAGISYIDIDFQYDIDYFNFNNDLTGLGYVLGAGIDATVSKHIALRLGYEFTSGELEFNNAGNFKTNLSQVSVGVHYLF
ncbi:outer membrane beta-barrel protein [uncultured Shewanella sp.]|uniref:outer membrane protein n=1 Tax=uncultured Shewanella sp. TaxID=173975 RepID=UPI003458698B